jgi:hypothetical protein
MIADDRCPTDKLDALRQITGDTIQPGEGDMNASM